MATARAQWWDDVVSADVAHYYRTEANARLAVEKAAEGKTSKSGRRGSLIWGDRVRVLERKPLLGVARVSARGADTAANPMWMRIDQLGGEPLLELYVIDVGQGDGLLVVTPEGHHLVIDGGNPRHKQNSGKNAADFIDWKFSRDYLSSFDRQPDDSCAIQIDALIASHPDQDHFGGLSDLLSLDEEKNRAELRCDTVQVNHFYHPGLSWWFKTTGDHRTLGPTSGGRYTKLLTNRASAAAATANLDNPDTDTLAGTWGDFIHAVTQTRRASNANQFTTVTQVTTASHDMLPGFDDSEVDFHVLGPIGFDQNGATTLERLTGGASINTNGHSIVLRMDYKDRRIMLTGDLNTASQELLMQHFGDQFNAEFRCDVAKGCHHGSHDVSYQFLDGMRPLATVISSGDAETHNHPNPSIVAASALTGRRLVENDSLVAPLIYMTEVGRSIRIKKMGKMGEFSQAQPAYSRTRPTGVKKFHDTEEEMSLYRLYLGSSQKSAYDWPRLDNAKLVGGVHYGLVNVRTDGKRLLFAQLEEQGNDWAIATIEEQQIADAR